ncbi:sensor histidine kinase [Dyadobacter fermentans]|uniref:Signal transduction histidine kinase, LytS n=1 Tax=Dyadobacter fermentans (strain ATCC 700827 / DSM 18053 / CIP 107007 / KCTC 52180 / NS114) TaxID=471854 RepID=C6W286_DYAFD|nr:sensor histidine kinase [Dyadobacter fermentans]ACT92059.1 signal transduction histidine kinase, LytS [Dyadobacter fermentans DSM 18053]
MARQISGFNVKHVFIFIFSSLLYALCQMLLSNIVMQDDLWGKFAVQLTAHYVVVLTMCVADYNLLLFLNKHIPYSKNVSYRIMADMVGLTLISLALLWVFDWMIYKILHVPPTGLPPFATKFALGMLTNAPILLVFELIHYFRSEQKAIADSEKAKREVLLFQHETLKAQINPHFLFNSLNVLSSLIYLNPQNAKKFTKALSRSYRYVLSLNQQPSVTVAEEMEVLESYIFLMQMRFENAFTFTVHEDSGSESNKIVPLTMQLLLENVFKHNVATEEAPLAIQITIGKEYVSVENQVKPSSNADKSGIGLKYLKKQYQLFGKDIVVEHTGDQFIVKIPYIEP